MKRLTVSAIVLSVACAAPAAAQVRTNPSGKLFFEGDIVKHNLDNGQPGPFCVLQSRYMRGEAVAWRMRILQANGTPADDKVAEKRRRRARQRTEGPSRLRPARQPTH